MPTWGQILNEIRQTSQNGKPPFQFDLVRRKYLTLLHKHTNRETIIYMTNWTQPGTVSNPDVLSINDEDIQGLMEVIHGLKGPNLDLIIHSPGGSPEATEAFISYLRTKFQDIRVIIPQAAMSAATMLACSSNRIVMGKHSSIGPIDPQLILGTQLGVQMVPAQAILDQFELAKEECQDPKKLASWLPILGQYGPALLIQCKNAIERSKQLVSEWLESYMFAGLDNASEKATKIAEYLSNHKEFKTHGKHINREKAKEIGLIVEDLELDQDFQDLVLSVFHATTHTFGGTGTVKIIENHLGKAYIKQQQPQMVLVPKENVPKPK